MKAMLPFVKLHEYLKYGEYAFSTAMDGFKKSDCRVMIVHGAKDDTVPIECGYDIYYEQYGNDERFVFKRFDGRKHSVMNNWDGTRDFELFGEVVDFLDQSFQSR